MTRLGWIVLSALVVGSAQAQVGEEGRISTRSDVRMSIEGAQGTGGAKLDALAKTLGRPLGDVKACYAELVKERPEVVGTLVVQIDVPERGNAKVKAPNAAKALRPMDKCLDRAFGKLDVRDVPRPAGALVTLELSNSAAAKVGEVREREEAASHVDVTQAADGFYESQGKSLEGEVTYRVRAKGKTGSAVVERVHQGVRDALPSLFDCRRKAEKAGSPAGELALTVLLKGKAKPDVSVSSSTVAAERAPFCVDAALTQFLGNMGYGRALVTIEFAP